MILNPVSIATRGYAPLAAIAVATMGYVQLDAVLYPEGGLNFTGAAEITLISSLTPSGGVGFSGTAEVSFVPAAGSVGRRHWYRLGLGV
jgi:hypothetical protein